MKLYWCNTPNPQKARLGICELGLTPEIVSIDLFKGEHQSPEFAKVNPNKRLPVIDDDGFILWESNAILEYLGEREGKLWPKDIRGKANALRWMFFEAAHVTPAVAMRVRNILVAPKVGRKPDMGEVARADAALPPLLAVLDQNLTKSKWMAGDEFTLADCTYAPMFNTLRMAKFDLSPYPAALKYLAAWRERPSWAACGIPEFERAFSV